VEAQSDGTVEMPEVEGSSERISLKLEMRTNITFQEI